jgi:phenylpropionate dioxygenase-like ring-hydroxylating dioxygenase large terminal subunit
MIDDPVLLNDWHPVARSDQLADGGVLAAQLLGVDIVLWRAGGEVLAWQDLCVHRGARLSQGRVTGNSQLRCPYHGWRYDRRGRCTHMPAHPDQTPPARAVARCYQAHERYGMIWVCMGEPVGDVPPFPEWGDPRFATAVCGPFPHIRAHGPRLIENYLDAAHFPFVHEGVLGDPERPQLGDFEAWITPEGVESDPIEVYQPDPYGGSAGRVTYTYHAYRPLTAHFTKHMPTATNGMVLTITPHGPLDSTAWFLVATTALSDNAQLERDYTPRIAAIFEEDRAIVEGQRPELLPLDLQAELHLRSDRVAIAYRRWLRQLGLRHGAA